MTRATQRTLTLVVEQPSPNGGPPEQPTQLIVELGRNARSDLAWVSLREGLNKTTTVNRAIQVYKMVIEAQLRGRHLYIGDLNDGKVEEVRIV